MTEKLSRQPLLLKMWIFKLLAIMVLIHTYEPTCTASMRFPRADMIADIDTLVGYIRGYHPAFSSFRVRKVLKNIRGLKSTLPDSLTAVEFYFRLLPLISRIGDGHTWIDFPRPQALNGQTGNCLPLHIEIRGTNASLIVRHDLSGSPDPIPEGALLLEVNGTDATLLSTSALSSVSGERTDFKKARLNHEDILYYLPAFWQSPGYSVRYTHNGTIHSRFLEGISFAARDRRLRNSTERQPGITLSVFPSPRSALLTIGNFTPEITESLCNSIFSRLRSERIRHLIIDIRENGGGYTSAVDTLCQYILPRPYRTNTKTRFRVTRLSRQMFPYWNMKNHKHVTAKQSLIPLQENPLRYSGNIYLLTSNYTYSAACAFADTFDSYGNGLIIGEETGGCIVSFGASRNISLPATYLECHISTVKVYGNRKTKRTRGVRPDIPVPSPQALPTARKIIENAL